MSREYNRTDAALRLLADVAEWCARTATPETTIGHALFLHPGLIGLMRKRLTVSIEKEQILREFMAAHPNGWRGELPKTHANGTRPVKRDYSPEARARAKRRTVAADFVEPKQKPVERDPCPRCGVRGDIGCSHTKALLGMML